MSAKQAAVGEGPQLAEDDESMLAHIAGIAARVDLRVDHVAAHGFAAVRYRKAAPWVIGQPAGDRQLR